MSTYAHRHVNFINLNGIVQRVSGDRDQDSSTENKQVALIKQNIDCIWFGGQTDQYRTTITKIHAIIYQEASFFVMFSLQISDVILK